MKVDVFGLLWLIGVSLCCFGSFGCQGEDCCRCCSPQLANSSVLVPCGLVVGMVIVVVDTGINVASKLQRRRQLQLLKSISAAACN